MKLWGGRFQQNTDSYAESFHSSISFDSRMYRQDILGSIAHATMLGVQHIIDPADAEAIVQGLKEILADIEAGKVEFSVHDEDIHMNIERILIERIGDVGKKLHTGRSRNDQVALDIRMYMKDTIKKTVAALKGVMEALVGIAGQNLHTVMSAYTHLQKAQPTTLAHYMMAYYEMFQRDAQRFLQCQERTDYMPLGSGALCSTTYPLDRELVAQQLGFAHITANSLDGVSDRDFLLEYLSDASIAMMHLSRLCEELVLWSSTEFSYMTFSDQFSTGSSIMPQKKNPDMAELIRGKTGRVYGSLITLLTVLKSLPLAYNKDMQEDKECVFDAADTLIACLTVAAQMLKTATFHKDKLFSSALNGFTNATDLADYLVKKGLSFRDAHGIVGKIVLDLEQQGKAISDLSIEELQGYSDIFEPDVYDAVSLTTCVNARCIPGGPAPQMVSQHIQKAQEFLSTL